MKLGLWILGGILFLGIGVYQSVYRVAHANVIALSHGPNPELEWLRQEFAIEDAQWEVIRTLHAAHDEQCLAFCAELEATNADLLGLMRESREVTPEVEAVLRKATELRERCRRTTLQHVYEVSRNMSPEAGKRYVEMMTTHLVDESWHEHMVPGYPGNEATSHGKHP